AEALSKERSKSLDDFASLADWGLAGGWTTEGGKRWKDDGVLGPFGVSLEDAQTVVMTARVMLGWVDPTELEADDDVEAEEEDEN
ncbi:transcription termination/antitermination protein NusA, partial [Staphylococcus pseudintermedius]